MCDTIRYKNIKDTQNFSANPEDTESIQNETTINIIEPVVEKKIKTFTYILTIFSVFTCLFILILKTLKDIQEQEFKTLKDIQEINVGLKDIKNQEIDVVLRNGEFFRNVIVALPIYLFSSPSPNPITREFPSSKKIDISQYYLIKTLISTGDDFLTNIELIKQLPNIETLYLHMTNLYVLDLEFILIDFDLPSIKSVYIINEIPDPYNRIDYSKLPNLEFLYIYNPMPKFSSWGENLKTLYLDGDNRMILRSGYQLNLSHLKSIETLHLDIIDDDRITLSDLNNLTSLTIKGYDGNGCDISNIDFSGSYNIKNLDISCDIRQQPNTLIILKRLTNLITLKYRWISNENGNGGELRGVTLKYLFVGGFLQTRQQMLDFGIIIRE